MRHEAGGHRIQRIPPTERRGRVHTSTVTVSVLDGKRQTIPAVTDDDISIRWFSGTGAGGQHRNKKMCSVELIHLPTGIKRSAQTRSRENSMKLAREALDQAINEHYSSGSHAAENAMRSTQIGLGMRGDKRRTYRFRDDFVSDDQTGLSASCSRVMRGGFDQLWPKEDRPKM